MLGEAHIETPLSSNSKKDEKGENLELPTTMLMIAANTSGDDINNFEEIYIK